MMSGIKGKNTRPELLIRSGLHRLGFRFRLHARDLPGRPDIVLPKYRAVIFVHGCFWHGHDCHLFKWPATRKAFWRRKIDGNIERDRRLRRSLTEGGWRFLVIWECSLKGRTRLDHGEVTVRVARWLRGDDLSGEIRGTA
jgi:DNA mismatch endonuclease (patch repair protein)